MSVYRDRTGQRIGTLEVLGDTGRRSRRGRVIWRCVEHSTGRERYLTTWKLIRLDRRQLGENRLPDLGWTAPDPSAP